MKISALQDSQYVSSALKNSNNTKTSFGAGYWGRKQLTNDIIKNSANLPKKLMSWGKNNGEILTTIIIGIGTAFVAPIFIAFNPFSKEDSQMKAYSAWRQPISAVLAVAAQIGINIKFNEWLDKLASTGQLDRANLKASPADSHLKKLIKLEHPEYDKKQINAEIEKRHTKSFWETVENLRKTKKTDKIEYKDLITKDFLSEAKDELKKEFTEQIQGMSEKQTNQFLAPKIEQRALEIVERTVTQEAKVKTEVRKLAKEGKPVSEVMANLTAKISDLKNAKSDTPELKLMEKVLDKLKGVDDFSKLKDLGVNYDEILQNIKIKQLVKSSINNAQTVLSSYKKWGGIFVSLVTLPVSCGLLNWTYPRLMEKIMPEAYAAKKAKEQGNSEVKKVA